MSIRHQHLRADQQGATLIILLVMMVVVTLLALSSVRSSTMDEKITGNTRDRDRAFQATEAAVRRCLGRVNEGLYPVASILTPVTSGAQNWEVDTNWSGSSSVEVDVGDSTLAHQPRCMVETLGATSGSFRVTGKGYGGSESSVVILQATYSTE
jgi:type IV pilus assembly protein PilX